MNRILTAASNTSASLLRSYQEECIKETIKAYESGLNRVCVSLPVGSGKTVLVINKVTFAHLIPRIPGSDQRKKTLVLAHRKELLTQAYNVIKRFSPELVLDF